MCGIAYIKFKEGNANQAIKKLYYHQRGRGQEGYGFVALDTMAYQKSKHEQEIFALMKKCGSQEILFHHRRPTSTENTVLGAQPIETTDAYYDDVYYLAHNGTISNHAELYNKHKELGIKYSTLGVHNGIIGYNDSEALLHELALCIEGKQELDKFDARGGMAFVLIRADRDGNKKEIFFGHNSNSPLKCYHKEGDMIVSSEGPGDDVTEDKLYSIGEDDILYVRPLKMYTWASAINKGPWKSKEDLEKELGDLKADEDIGTNLFNQEKDPEERYRLAQELADVKNRIKIILKELDEKKKYTIPTSYNSDTKTEDKTIFGNTGPRGSLEYEDEDLKHWMGH